jgi:hypothetical protein
MSDKNTRNINCTYHSKHNIRAVPVNKDGLPNEYYPEWFATRLAIIREKNGERYPVAFDVGECCLQTDNGISEGENNDPRT